MKKSILMISLVMSFLLVLGTLSSFSQNSLFPKDHPYRLFAERRISQFANFPVTPGSIVFLGDSLIDEGRWEEFFPNLKICNRGVLADRTQHVLSRLHQITKGKPDKVFIMAGTNDLKFGLKQKIIFN